MRSFCSVFVWPIHRGAARLDILPLRTGGFHLARNHNLDAMTPPPTVSIVVPAFMRPHYLETAIRSVLAQEWPDWTLAVYDDSDLHDNRDVVSSFSDRRLHYHANARRLGHDDNKFYGWRQATGDYIINLDDDDTWEPRFLSTVVPILEADTSLAAAFVSQYIIDEAGGVDRTETAANEARYRGGLAPGRHGAIDRIVLIDQAMPVATGTVVRRNAIDWDLIPDEKPIHSDYWLGYMIARSGLAAYFHKEPLVSYRVHPGSVTKVAGVEWHAAWAGCYRGVLRDERLRELWPTFRSRLAFSERRVAALELLSGDIPAARSASRKALAAAVTPATVIVAAAAFAGRLGGRQALAAIQRLSHRTRSLTRLVQSVLRIAAGKR